MLLHSYEVFLGIEEPRLAGPRGVSPPKPRPLIRFLTICSTALDVLSHAQYMKLAWYNILHNRVRLLVTVLGIAFAVCLMIFQGGLLFGFLQAASKLTDASVADLWISARGVNCFEFPAPLPEKFFELSRGVPGVERASRIVTAMAQYRQADGKHQVIALVGADPGLGPAFPVPRAALGVNSVLVDRSNLSLLGVRRVPLEAEINRRRARVVGETAGFSSFLGSPYVFASYRDAVDYLGLGPNQATYIALGLDSRRSAGEVKRMLQSRLTEADVWTREEFSSRSRRYWLTQTGAGGGILTAAVLGFLIGLVVVSQTMYATTMENLEEFSTLKALGASDWFVARVVLIQALACGAAGGALGLAATWPLVRAAQTAIPWITIPAWLPLVMLPASFLMCCLAALASVRAAITADPARVFRA